MLVNCMAIHGRSKGIHTTSIWSTGKDGICEQFNHYLAAFCSKYLWQQQVRAATKMTNSLKSTWESLFSSRFLKTLSIASLSFPDCKRKRAGWGERRHEPDRSTITTRIPNKGPGGALGPRWGWGGHLGSVRPMPVQTPCTFPRGIAIELPGRWVGGMRWGCNGSCMQPCHRPAQNIRLSCFLLVRLFFFLLSACFVHCISEYKAMKSFAPCLAETTAQRPALDVGLRYLRLPVLVGAAHLLR